jgi:hypothetical protein
VEEEAPPAVATDGPVEAGSVVPLADSQRHKSSSAASWLKGKGLGILGSYLLRQK